MNKPNNSPQMNALLQKVSGKLGIPAEQLQQELQTGKFDRAIAALKPQEQAAFRQVLADPKQLDRLMNSKQARALYEKLTKG